MAWGVFEGSPVVGGQGVVVLKGGRFFAALRMTRGALGMA